MLLKKTNATKIHEPATVAKVTKKISPFLIKIKNEITKQNFPPAHSQEAAKSCLLKNLKKGLSSWIYGCSAVVT